MGKKIIFITLVVMLFLGCNEKKQEKISYTVGIDSNKIYPFGFLDEKTGEISGFEHDLIVEIAKRAHLKLEFVECSFLLMMSKIKNKEIDMGIGIISITEERKKIMKFSEPYIASQVVVLGNKENNLIDEKRVMYGITKGTYFKQLIDYKENIDILEKIDTEEVIKELILKNIDYAIIDKGVADRYRDKYPILYEKKLLKEDFIGIAFSSYLHNDFINKINNILLEMQLDGSLDNLKKKYGIRMKE